MKSILAWVFAIILLLVGSVFGFASSESYDAILKYSIAIESASLAVSIYIWRKSQTKGKVISFVLIILAIGVIAQAIYRLLHLYGILKA